MVAVLGALATGANAVPVNPQPASAQANEPELTPEQQREVMPILYRCLGEALIRRGDRLAATHVPEGDERMYEEANICANEAASHNPILEGLVLSPAAPTSPPPQ